jgi:hypothetical protein
MNLKKLERYLRVNLLGPGPRLMRKIIYRAAVSERLRNTYLDYVVQVVQTPFFGYIMRNLFKNQNEKCTSYEMKRS